MTADFYFNISLVSYAFVGLAYATYIIFKHNRHNSKLLIGLYGMYAATLFYFGCEFAFDLGFGVIWHMAAKVTFIIFLTIAMPWSINVYMRLTDHMAKKKKDEKAAQG